MLSLRSATFTVSAASSVMKPPSEPNVFHFSHVDGSSAQSDWRACALNVPMQLPSAETVNELNLASEIGRMITLVMSPLRKIGTLSRFAAAAEYDPSAFFVRLVVTGTAFVFPSGRR